MMVTKVTWKILIPSEIDANPVRNDFADSDKENTEIYAISLGSEKSRI